MRARARDDASRDSRPRRTPGRDSSASLPPGRTTRRFKFTHLHLFPPTKRLFRSRPVVSNGGKREHAQQQTRYFTLRCLALGNETPRKPTHVNYLSFSPSRLKDNASRISRHVTSAFSFTPIKLSGWFSKLYELNGILFLDFTMKRERQCEIRFGTRRFRTVFVSRISLKSFLLDLVAQVLFSTHRENEERETQERRKALGFKSSCR